MGVFGWSGAILGTALYLDCTSSCVNALESITGSSMRPLNPLPIIRSLPGLVAIKPLAAVELTSTPLTYILRLTLS